MSHDFWNPSPPPMNGWQNSSDNWGFFVMKELYQQTGLLGEIKADVRRIPAIEEQVERNRIDIAILKADRPNRRERVWWRDIPKENWSWIATVLVVVMQTLLFMAGRPEMAEKLGSISQRQDYGDSSR